MAKQQSRSKPLIERIQDRIRDLLDGLAESLDGGLATPAARDRNLALPRWSLRAPLRVLGGVVERVLGSVVRSVGAVLARYFFLFA